MSLGRPEQQAQTAADPSPGPVPSRAQAAKKACLQNQRKELSQEPVEPAPSPQWTSELPFRLNRRGSKPVVPARLVKKLVSVKRRV